MDDKNIRLIDANALVADYRICGGCKDFKNCDGHVVMCDSARVRQAINDVPTIEVQPVKHGRVYYDCEGHMRCSVCNEYDHDLIYDRFCPNCGVRLDGDNHD